MSTARKCDKCGALFESKRGCLTLGEVCIDEGERAKDGSVTYGTWSDVDLCHTCSQAIIVHIHEALRGLSIDKLYGPEKKRRGSQHGAKHD